MSEWIDIEFLVITPYMRIGKGSIVYVKDIRYKVKRIDGIILLDESVGKSNTIKVFARGIKQD